MSDSGGSARPRQLTMAGGFVIGGSIFLVLTVFDALASLDSVERREQLSEMLSSPPFDGLGLTMADLLAGMRVGLPITAVCAAAAGVLGVFVLQRHRGARLALTVLAVPLLLSTFLTLTGGFLGALVVAATLMLWSGPARDWFAGRPIRDLEPPARESRPGPWETTMPSAKNRNQGQDPPPVTPPADQSDTPSDSRDAPAASELTTTGSSTAPVPTTGFGERVPPVAEQQPAPWVPSTYAEVARGMSVPVTVKVACFLTWGFSGLVALLYFVVLLVLIFARDRMVDLVVKTPEWERANLDADVLVPALWVGVLMFLGWALGACILAWFAWRRQGWARWLLAVSAGTTLLVGFLAFPVGVLHQLAAGLAIAGLFSSAAREWYARPSWTPGGPPGGQSGGQGGAPGGWQGGPQDSPTDDSGWQNAPPPDYPSGPPQQGSGQGQQPAGGKPPVW